MREMKSKEASLCRFSWASFPEDPYAALEEVRKMLGLTENELDTLLALLWKADDGHLHFHVGNVCIAFFNRSFDEKEIVFDIEVEKEKIASSVKYKLCAEDGYLRNLHESSR